MCSRGITYCPQEHDKFLDGLRLIGLKWFIMILTKSFFLYLKKKYGPNWHLKSRRVKKRKRVDNGKMEELIKDSEAGRDVLKRVLAGDWPEWIEGSWLIFWMWPEFYKK